MRAIRSGMGGSQPRMATWGAGPVSWTAARARDVSAGRFFMAESFLPAPVRTDMDSNHRIGDYTIAATGIASQAFRPRCPLPNTGTDGKSAGSVWGMKREPEKRIMNSWFTFSSI